jgi:hypothetical protein
MGASAEAGGAASLSLLAIMGLAERSLRSSGAGDLWCPELKSCCLAGLVRVRAGEDVRPVNDGLPKASAAQQRPIMAVL